MMYLDMACRYNLAMLVMASFRMLHWKRGRKIPLIWYIRTCMWRYTTCTCTVILSLLVMWLLKQALLSEGVGWCLMDIHRTRTIPSRLKILMVNLYGHECFLARSTCIVFSNYMYMQCLLLNWRTVEPEGLVLRPVNTQHTVAHHFVSSSLL